MDKNLIISNQIKLLEGELLSLRKQYHRYLRMERGIVYNKEIPVSKRIKTTKASIIKAELLLRNMKKRKMQ